MMNISFDEETRVFRLDTAGMTYAVSVTDEEGCHVRLAMSDGKGEIISMSLLCAGEEQAKTMKKTFRRSAEEIYQRIVEILCEEGK